jgi:hypothetical protein
VFVVLPFLICFNQFKSFDTLDEISLFGLGRVLELLIRKQSAEMKGVWSATLGQALSKIEEGSLWPGLRHKSSF